MFRVERFWLLRRLLRACLDGMSFEWYHSIFCFHHPNRVGPTDEHLFGWVLDHCFHNSILWFLSDELWKLKTHFRFFQFPNSVFNGIFIIKRTYPTTMFDKRIYLFIFFLFFFFWWNPAATFEVENWVWVKVPNRGFGKLRYFKWWVMTNYKPNKP